MITNGKDEYIYRRAKAGQPAKANSLTPGGDMPPQEGKAAEYKAETDKFLIFGSREKNADRIFEIPAADTGEDEAPGGDKALKEDIAPVEGRPLPVKSEVSSEDEYPDNLTGSVEEKSNSLPKKPRRNYEDEHSDKLMSGVGDKNQSLPKKPRRNKNIKKVFEYLLAFPAGEAIATMVQKKGLEPGEDLTVGEAIAAMQVAKALEGDMKAFELIRGILWEKPASKKDFEIKDLSRVIIVRAGDEE